MTMIALYIEPHIHLYRSYVHKTFSGCIHLNLSFNSLRAFSNTGASLTLIILLSRDWDRLLTDLKNSKKIRACNHDIEQGTFVGLAAGGRILRDSGWG